jgi:hypothetical protein
LVPVLEGEKFFDFFEHLCSMVCLCEFIQQSKGFLRDSETGKV